MTIEATRMMTTVLDPTAPPAAVYARLAPRPESLNGLRLGLLDNHKRNAAGVLDEIEKLISQRYELASVVRRYKTDVSRPCPEETVADLAAQADAVIIAIGD
ncbi:MAG: hypothetical protein EXR49_05280 [Dehalococcoidia bacterium]|nr:hypothetical protein [Dehalococcoidia bacterium]